MSRRPRNGDCTGATDLHCLRRVLWEDAAVTSFAIASQARLGVERVLLALFDDGELGHLRRRLFIAAAMAGAGLQTPTDIQREAGICLGGVIACVVAFSGETSSIETVEADIDAGSGILRDVSTIRLCILANQ